MNEPVRPETLALDALIEKTVVQAASAARHEPADRVLFLGNRHHAFPTAVIKDPVLEPVDKLVWMAIMLGVQETGGNTAFPGYGAIGRIANVASRSTIARAIAILRATRWLTLCRRVRTRSGRFCGNVYALHDEPLPLADACHLDADYRVFLRQAAEHTHRRVRVVAQGVLQSIDEDARMGCKVMAPADSIERRIESIVGSADGTHRRFFAFTRNAVRQLRKDLVTAGQTNDNPVQKSNTVNHDQISNSVGSSSYIYKKTTTETEVSNFDATDEDGQSLVYPRRLGERHREIANRHLSKLSPTQRQSVLDELEGRFQAEQKGMKPVYDEISFLISLCKLTEQGTFQPNLGIKVRDRRIEREAMRQRVRTAAAATVSDESEEQREERRANGQARLASLRQALRKSHHQSSALSADAPEKPSE